MVKPIKEKRIYWETRKILEKCRKCIVINMQQKRKKLLKERVIEQK